MLASVETIRVVADALRRWDVKTSVVDPVSQDIKTQFHSKLELTVFVAAR